MSVLLSTAIFAGGYAVGWGLAWRRDRRRAIAASNAPAAPPATVPVDAGPFRSATVRDLPPLPAPPPEAPPVEPVPWSTPSAAVFVAVLGPLALLAVEWWRDGRSRRGSKR